MCVQKYPLTIIIYKGENRILVVPMIDHIGNYSVNSENYIRVEDMEDEVGIGKAVLKAIEIIKVSPISAINAKEREENAAWRKDSRYKSWTSFWKNNLCASFEVDESGVYRLDMLKRLRRERSYYGGCIKEINLAYGATPEEIGYAVIDVFKAAEDYYKEQSMFEQYPVKDIELADGTILTVKHPEDKNFNDYQDAGAAEIYQCYSYIPEGSEESSADFYIGMATELDCCLDTVNIRNSWEKAYGAAEFFQTQEVDYGIFKLRAEMKNKSIHKISYLLQMDDDLLLECSMELNYPNRRKKLDERLSKMFEEFVLKCHKR